MEQEHDLSDERCDRLVDMAMEKLAAKVGMSAHDLNPNIETHHTLRRTLVRVAYELGKAAAESKVPN